MASKTFKQILEEAERKGVLRENYRDSVQWFREKARKVSTTTQSLMRDRNQLDERVRIGRMYAFHYDPKYKRKMPYYDRFPITIILDRTDEGFLAINLHYLPPRLRAELMNELWDITNNNKLDETTKMRISYERLKRASRFKNFRPTVKYYLNKHVKSRFLRIEAEEWNIAAFLPVEKFEKATKNKIWSDSRRKIFRS